MPAPRAGYWKSLAAAMRLWTGHCGKRGVIVSGLLVIVPTRGRKENCERLLASFRDTAGDGTDIAFILDPDDEATYDGVEWGDALHAVLAPRGTLADKLNQTAAAMTAQYGALMWTGDDHVFGSPGWDKAMLDVLAGMGGDGWVFPNTVRRQDVPEIWLASAGLTDELGWFFPPHVSQYYGDNTIAELGKRSGLIRYCPQAAVEHLHYSVSPDTEHDETYREAEEAHGAADLQAFQQWRADQMPYEVARIRRRFNSDISWVLGRVA